MSVDVFILALTWVYWHLALGVLFVCTAIYGWRSGGFWFALLHCSSATLLLISEYAINAPGLEFLAERPLRPSGFRLLDTLAYLVLFAWLFRRFWRLRIAEVKSNG